MQRGGRVSAEVWWHGVRWIWDSNVVRDSDLCHTVARVPRRGEGAGCFLQSRHQIIKREKKIIIIKKSGAWKQDALRCTFMSLCNITLPRLPDISDGSLICFQIC